MISRNGIALAVLAGLCALIGSSVDANACGGGDCCNWDQRECCEFQFSKFNCPKLYVDCEKKCDWEYGKITVRTNACTLVSWSHTNYVRYERDCCGDKVYDTKDEVNAYVGFGIRDLNPNCGGHGLGICGFGQNSFVVESHNGGYELFAYLFADPNGWLNLCNDAGCYKAKLKVCISLVPQDEQCCD